MKYCLLILLFTLSSCAALKTKDIIGAKAEVKAPIITSMQVQPVTGVGNELNKTSAGRDVHIINDPKLLQMFIDSQNKDDARTARKDYMLIGIISAQFILQGWMLKFLLREQKQDDIFKENMLKEKKYV